MKGILRVGLLMALQTLRAAHAFESDIHYSTTYVLARAVGWPEGDAVTIASANQGVDENHDTVAALEVEATRGTPVSGYVMNSFRQAEKNLRFHCFSRTREEGERISADVRKVISRHFADVPDPRGTPQSDSRRLIALGVALHCQQDAHSHVGFGGSCGSHSGNCHGHAYQTLLDQMAFLLLEKHYFNPDHPGVSGERLLEALQETVHALAAHRPAGASRSIADGELAALANALRTSGLDLPDEVRRDCNRHVAGKWLHDFFQSRRRTRSIEERMDRVAPVTAASCRNRSLASANIVRIPAARYPRLGAEATPQLVRVDGTYQLIREGQYAVNLPRLLSPAHPVALTSYNPSRVRLHLSHWKQLPALAHGNQEKR